MKTTIMQWVMKLILTGTTRNGAKDLLNQEQAKAILPLVERMMLDKFNTPLSFGRDSDELSEPLWNIASIEINVIIYHWLLENKPKAWFLLAYASVAQQVQIIREIEEDNLHFRDEEEE